MRYSNIISYCKRLVTEAFQDQIQYDGKFEILPRILFKFGTHTGINLVGPLLEELNSVIEKYFSPNVLFSDVFEEFLKSLVKIKDKNQEILKSLVTHYHQSHVKNLPDIEFLLANFALELMSEDIMLEIFNTF